MRNYDNPQIGDRADAYRSLITHAADLLLVSDDDGVIRYASPAARRILGRDPSELVGSTPLELFHPDDVELVAAAYAQKLGFPGRDTPVDCRVRHRDGSWRWLEAATTNLLDDPGVRGMVINARDISERKSLGEQLAQQALHDPLTGLPNRALLDDRLSQALDRLGRQSSQLTVLLLDLDQFKDINDTMGHHIGDELLVAVAERLTLVVRPQDTVARLGGDEFVLVCDVVDRDDAVAVADRVSAAFDGPFQLSSTTVAITASIGFTVTSDPGMPSGKLLRDADVAMYRAKKLGRARHVAADPDMRDSVAQRLQVEGALRGALEGGQLRVAYQPIVALGDGHVVGAEALIRWDHPEHGHMLPADFIASAEHTGLIVPIGWWVLEQACALGAEWAARQPDLPPPRISVNITVRELAEPGFADALSDLLAATGLPAGTLSLELRERALLRSPHTAHGWLDALRRLGVRVLIDDFSGANATIRHLRELPVDGLKAPAGDPSDAVDRAIVRSGLLAAEALGAEFIAEGVERAEQAAELRRLGCRFAQGFHFGRPTSAEAFARRLAGDVAR